MIPFTIHYRAARWSFTLLPIHTSPSSLPYITSISSLIIFISSIYRIVCLKGYDRIPVSTHPVAISRKPKRRCVEANTTVNGSAETPNKVMTTVGNSE